MIKFLLTKGLSRAGLWARALILAGEVLVDGRIIYKAGEMVDASAEITFKGKDIPSVSRGGLKLEKVLDEFKIEVSGKVAMDVGASTGGFTYGDLWW